ncbi:MAG: hypothetical protein AAGA44_11260 [Pseudomonadota bacterium]
MSDRGRLWRTAWTAAIIAVLVILAYSSKYLPEAPDMFASVVLLRLIASCIPAVLLLAMMLLILKLSGAVRWRQLAVSLALLTFSIVSVLMVAVSLGEPFPDGMFNAYLQHR